MDKIFLERFRLINEPVEIDIKPITILTGRNNSGKSSIIKAILLLSDFLEQEQQLHLDYNGKFSSKHKLFSFSNTRNWYNEKKSFNISIIKGGLRHDFIFKDDINDFGTLDSFKLSKKEREGISLNNNLTDILVRADLNFFVEDKKVDNEINKYSELLKNLNAEFEDLKIYFEGKKTPQEKIAIKEQLNNVSNKIREVNKILNNTLSAKGKIIIQKNVLLKSRENNEYYQLNLSSIVRDALGSYFYDKSQKEFLNDKKVSTDLFTYIDSFKDSLNFKIDYLGPNRTYQSRLYLRENQFQEINEICTEYSKHTPVEGSIAKRFLVKWLKEFGVGDDIFVKPVVENSGSVIMIKIEGVDNLINLADKGYGAGQITTTLLKITNIINRRVLLLDNNQWVMLDPTLLIIEEPEANLHPSYQSKLAELFIEANKLFGIKFILETHSEYLIRKFQVLIKDRVIHEPNKVVIYYLDETENHNVIGKRISIRNDGTLSDRFGTGFFDVASNLTFDLL